MNKKTTPHWNPLHPHSRRSTITNLTGCASRCMSHTLQPATHPPKGITVNDIHNVTTTTLTAHHSKQVQMLTELNDWTPIQHFTTSNDKHGHTSTSHVRLEPECTHNDMIHCLNRDAMHNKLIEFTAQQQTLHSNDQFGLNTSHGHPTTLTVNQCIKPPSKNPRTKHFKLFLPFFLPPTALTTKHLP